MHRYCNIVNVLHVTGVAVNCPLFLYKVKKNDAKDEDYACLVQRCNPKHVNMFMPGV